MNPDKSAKLNKFDESIGSRRDVITSRCATWRAAPCFRERGRRRRSSANSRNRICRLIHPGRTCENASAMPRWYPVMREFSSRCATRESEFSISQKLPRVFVVVVVVVISERDGTFLVREGKMLEKNSRRSRLVSGNDNR